MKTKEQLAAQLDLSEAAAADVLNTLNLRPGLVGVFVFNGQYWWREIHAPKGAVFFDRETVFAPVAVNTDDQQDEQSEESEDQQESLPDQPDQNDDSDSQQGNQSESAEDSSANDQESLPDQPQPKTKSTTSKKATK